MTRETLQNLYLQWVNDYASLATFAEHHGLYEAEALILLELAKSCLDHPHPEA